MPDENVVEPQTEGTVAKLVKYEDLTMEEAEREVVLEDYATTKTLAEAEEDTEHKTDIRAGLQALTPQVSDKYLNDVLQPAMVSRIPPDNILDKMKLLVLRQLWHHAPTDRVDVIGIISNVQDVLFIGLEGRGISDRLELMGVAREHEEEMEQLSKELGLR